MKFNKPQFADYKKSRSKLQAYCGFFYNIMLFKN